MEADGVYIGPCAKPAASNAWQGMIQYNCGRSLAILDGSVPSPGEAVTQLLATYRGWYELNNFKPGVRRNRRKCTLKGLPHDGDFANFMWTIALLISREKLHCEFAIAVSCETAKPLTRWIKSQIALTRRTLISSITSIAHGNPKAIKW